MKILFACHRFPFPPNRGGKIRPFHMISHLSRQHEVTVVSLAHTNDELEQGKGLREHCQEILADVLPSSERWRNAAIAMASGRAASVAYFRSKRLLRRVAEHAARNRFDAVMVHCAFAAQYVVDVPASLRILDFGDLDSGKWFDYAEERAFPLSLAYLLEARRLRKYESDIARKFNSITVTTSGEGQEFQKLGANAPLTVIPNGVDQSYFQPNEIRPESRIIVFLGRMDYYPNVQGVTRFAQEIFPLVRNQEPTAKLRIVGANPTAAVRKLTENPAIEVTGFVRDVRPYLADAAVAVAPLYLARGTQNKILEAMSAGIPVVSTPEAAKGIRAEPGEHLLVGEDAQDFARQTVMLLRDAELRRRFAEGARRQIQSAHNWENSMKVLDEVVNRAAVPV